MSGAAAQTDRTQPQVLPQLQALLVAPDQMAARRIEAALAGHAVRCLERVADPVAALARFARAPVDAVVLTSGRANTARDAAIRSLRSGLPDDVPVVVVGPPDSRRGVRMAIESGAAGLVFDRDLQDRLGPTIRAATTGQVVVPISNRHELGRPSLSLREKEILRLIVMGCTNREIGATLFLAESTVKCHLSTAFSKLGVRSRNEAVDLILDQGAELGLGILAISPQSRAS